MPNTFTFETDSLGKAGAIRSINSGTNFYVPTWQEKAGYITGTIINAMNANSSWTTSTAVTTTAPSAGAQADFNVQGYGLTTLQSTVAITTAPTAAPTLSTATTGGSLPAATYYVKFTWVSSSGIESIPSPEVSMSTTGTTSTLTVSNIPSLPAGIASANIYISTATGTETKQNPSPVTTTTYTQTAALSAGTAVPTTNPTAILNFYGSSDGVNFISVNATSKSLGSTSVSTAIIPDIYSIDTRGIQYLRVLITNYATGTPAGTYISLSGLAEAYAGDSNSVSLTNTSVMQPVDLQAIYYKSQTGLDAIPIYSPDAIQVNSDTIANTLYGIPVAPQNLMWSDKSAKWERMRNNSEGTLLSSAARTSTTTSTNQINYNAKGILLTLNVTTASGTGGLTPKIQAIDPVTGSVVQFQYINGNPTAVTALGGYVYLIYPGVTTNSSVQQAFNAAIPRTWNLFVAHGDSSTYAYSVGYSYIL